MVSCEIGGFAISFPLDTVIGLPVGYRSQRVLNMKRKICITILSLLVFLLVILGAGVGYVIIQANSLVESHRAEIEQQIASAIGAPVQFGQLNVSLFPSLELSIADIVVKDLSDGVHGVTFKKLRAKAALLPLLAKKIAIHNITLEEPHIVLIKSAHGVAVKGIVAKPPARSTPVASNQTTTPPSPSKLDLSINRVMIKDGTITIHDLGTNKKIFLQSINLDAQVTLEGSRIGIPKLSLSLTPQGAHNLDLQGDGISFAQASGDLAIRSLTLKSLAGQLLASGRIKTSAGTGQLALSSNGIDLAPLMGELKDLVPNLEVYKPTGVLVLDSTVTLQGSDEPTLALTLTPKNLAATLPGAIQLSKMAGAINVSGKPSDLMIESKGLALALHEAPLRTDLSMRVTPTGVELTTFIVRGFGGELTSPSALKLGPPISFNSQSKASQLNLTQILTAFKPALANSITGTLTTLNSELSGVSHEDIARSLHGHGSFILVNGALKGTNLPMAVLSEIGTLPFVSGLLTSHIPDKYTLNLNAKDTVIQELSGSYSIANGVTTVKDLTLVSDICTFTSNGTISLDGELNLNSTFTFSPDFSLGLAKGAKGLDKALNNAQQLVIPVIIKGRSPAILVLPDVTKLLLQTLTKLPREAINILGGVLGADLSKPKGGSKKGRGGILGF